MDKFLSNRFQTLETVSGLKGIKAYKAPKAQSLQHFTETTPKKMGNFQVSVAKHMCKLCVTDDHKLQSCPKFRKLKVTDRIACVKSNNCCLNCLSSGHTVSRCKSSYNCSTCHSRHNTLLHITAVQPKAAALKESRDPADDLPSTSKEALKRLDSNGPKDSRTHNFKSCYSNTDNGVLLGTAMVNIFHNNVNFTARALIDSGSECSFITERLKRRINLPSKRLHAQVSGVNNSISAQVRQACSLQLRSSIDPYVKINTIALVLPQLTGNLPTCLVSAMTRQAFPDLTLADKRFFVNEPVDLVLGGDIYPQIILSGLKKNVLSTLLAQETVFGWILTGRAETVSPPNKIVSLFSEVTLDYGEFDNIRIPRWVHYSPADNAEIHGFCDASEKAYAAAVYLRVKKQDQVYLNLLLAKTRVAPVKTISLPRLELCGAVLLADIIETVTENLSLAHLDVHLWTDSTIVLAWIRKPPCSWSTFVAHRVTKIVEKVGNNNWRHVDSASNPADLASRGLPAKELVHNSLWWQGPSYLQEDKSRWPTSECNYETTMEEKKVKVYSATTINFSDILDRFSNLPRALRVLSYIMRFSQRTHPNTKIEFQAKSCFISPDEIKATTQRLIINSQKQYYGGEYAKLKQKKTVDTKSEILALNPFLDKDDIMRAGGRLGASLNLSYNERHPIILPYNSRLSRLITKFINEISLHGENQLMLRLIRTQYWIPRVKNMIRSIIHNCKICMIKSDRKPNSWESFLRYAPPFRVLSPIQV
ncbi:uncharacterized protein LOC129251360 [Anastrepha obliqua]|uniref:uncharacterized protein LOC129251359 n=1 Tax=Anastrepha obliqua TaxID=95512 RepID=UPI002409F2A5|nr:uncharacterized protein LOC129251359 [Anastrepha obliqua]XP_054746733.1 uncharacterized protein LOC129251360 [Anastrepha obliqua]